MSILDSILIYYYWLIGNEQFQLFLAAFVITLFLIVWLLCTVSILSFFYSMFKGDNE